ncbi:MAG: hypothetical protein ABEH86_07935 [Haloarcula sp.]
MEITDFVSQNAPDESQDHFELENSNLLDIDVDGFSEYLCTKGVTSRRGHGHR